jgi:AcrR family transcriptional regulator
VPPDASKTKAKLLDSAVRAFARDGVFNASLIDLTRQAGQRNRTALSYHFGSRDGILCAVIDRHALFLARREGELLDVAGRAAGLEPVVEALVRPRRSLRTAAGGDVAAC